VRKVIVFLTDGTPDPDPKKAGDKIYMNKYMDSLWETVSGLALSKYPVYTVGFSEDIDPLTLQKISTETRGEYRNINSSAELASSFFQILCNLKNRNNFLDRKWNIVKEKNYVFELDKFTSQVTLVFTYSDENPIDINLVPPKEKNVDSKLLMNKTKKYTIITLNQNKEELAGKWTVNLKGNGSVKAFGAKDLFIKTWLQKPVSNSIHPLNDPIDIEAAVTGSQKDNLYVEAQIKKNGINEVFPVVLKYNNEIYHGVYDNTDQPGTYDIEIKVYQGKKLITSNTSKVFVKVLPTLETDFYKENRSYLLGKSTIITSWLSMNGNVIKPTGDLEIDHYQILINYENGKEGILPVMITEILKMGIYCQRMESLAVSLSFPILGRPRQHYWQKVFIRAKVFCWKSLWVPIRFILRE